MKKTELAEETLVVFFWKIQFANAYLMAFIKWHKYKYFKTNF